MKKRRAIIVCICILAAAAFTLALALPKKSYAAIGRNARKHYAEYETRHSDPQDEPAKDEDDDSSEFWFPVPEGYLNKKTDEKKYVSSINPDDTPEQWDALEDAVQMREVSQIPADILETVSTDELVLYCMNYNLFIDFMLFDTMQDGMENVRSDYNGIRELMTRPDAAESLIRLYKLYDLDEQKARDSVGCIRLRYLEAMLCMPEILNSLTAKQANELAAACAQKINKIVNDENSPYSVSTTMYLAAVSQYAASEEFAEIVNASSGAKRYIEEGILVPDEISDDTLGRIVSYFQEL